MLIQKLTLIFGSKTKAQEILLLIHGQKPVIRQGFLEHELPKVEKFCTKNHIFIVKSEFKVLFADDEISNYSNKGIRVPYADPRPGLYFVYLSKDEQKAWLAAYYEIMHKDHDLGLILGYPPCCVDFFCRNFNFQNTNPQLPPTNFYTNLTKRDQDMVLLSHFPCNSECEASIQIAKSTLELIKKIDKERAQEIQDAFHL